MDAQRLQQTQNLRKRKMDELRDEGKSTQNKTTNIKEFSERIRMHIESNISLGLEGPVCGTYNITYEP